MDAKEQSMTASWINVLAGLWLIVAPFILGYSGQTPATNDIWLGVIIGVLALIRAFSPLRAVWLSWINILAGIWLIIAPFVLGYGNIIPTWNDVILGIIVLASAVWSMQASGRASYHARV